MATKGKETPSPKEKRATSSSQPRKTNTLQQSKSPNTSKQASPVKTHDSTASERHIPNYLKPTICSAGLDLSTHQPKKNVTSDSKSKVTRRKSFDKPLLPSPIQKTCTSPSPKERSFRSSSFTTRSTTSQKSLPDRLLKSSKDVGKGPTLYGRPVSAKKSNTNIKKDENESSSAKEQKASTSTDCTPDIDVITEPGPHQEDLDASNTQADEQVLNLVNNNETGTKVFVVEDDRHMNLPEQYEAGSHEVEEFKLVESSMKGSEEPTTFQIEKPEEIMNKGESSKSHFKLKEHIDRDGDETIESKDKVKDKEDKEAKPEENRGQEMDKTRRKPEDEEDGEAKPEENIGGQYMDKNEEGNRGSSTEDVQLQEKENAEDHAKEIKHDVENEETNQQVIQGKKESSVSNHVIEETATKLREQRKNKVKALAGAFETVISLQEPK